MFSEAIVQFYRLVHGKLHLPGAGWLIKQAAPWLPGLQSYPLPVPGVGVVQLDFRDSAAFSLLNSSLGEFANERYLLGNLEKLLKPGDVFWDVGANVGFVSSYFAHPRYQLSGLHAFEPNPVPFKVLQSLFAAHPFGRAHPFGLGDKNETISMNVSSQGSCIGTMTRDLNENRQIQVQIRNGDGVRRELQLPCPNAIKIDVEGFEPNVFAGLSETIAECRPIIVFEHIWLSDDQIRQFAPRGYLLYFIHDDGTITTDFSTRLKGHDAIFIPKEKSALSEVITS
jgi:FkbM family methyltransferase